MLGNPDSRHDHGPVPERADLHGERGLLRFGTFAHRRRMMSDDHRLPLRLTENPARDLRAPEGMLSDLSAG